MAVAVLDLRVVPLACMGCVLLRALLVSDRDRAVSKLA